MTLARTTLRAATRIGVRLTVVAALAVSGTVHAQLYIDGYRSVPTIGVMFLIQGAASIALAVLLLLSPPGGIPVVLRLAAVGVALGALVGFGASRTVGVFGFTEHGLRPAPQAALSVLAELTVLALLTPPLLRALAAGWSARARTAAMRSDAAR
ncbi:hypothetical protein [Streptomyces sp. NPDC057694]|uniref:hypothetical protein n=1 Tax=Streptomyces sp. NPDC057694 TaxID=3346216 RepID=UPI00367EC9FD